MKHIYMYSFNRHLKYFHLERSVDQVSFYLYSYSCKKIGDWDLK